MVKILDSTLREGQQTPNVHFTTKQKVKIAEMLDDFGVEIIEAGYPFISSREKKSVREITKLGLNADVLAHTRARDGDIDAVAESGATWAGIFIGVNELSLDYKYDKSLAEVKRMIRNSVRLAKDYGLKVRFTVEDSTRTRIDDIILAAKIAKGAGADIIGLADTVGIATPENYAQLVKAVKSEAEIEIEVHCHNDFGLSTANALAAYEAGAKTIDVSVNGLGERCGISPLAEVCTALKIFYGSGNDWKLEKLPQLSRTVEKYSGINVSPIRPIVGKNAFTHTADLHRKAMKKEPACYQAMKPEVVGRKTILIG